VTGLLTPIDLRTVCLFKGQACVLGGGGHGCGRGRAGHHWSYRDPFPEVARLAGSTHD
jgi:uncharacterized protein (DUF427 family)